MSMWIDVYEDLPEIGEEVLLVHDGRIDVARREAKWEGWVWTNDDGALYHGSYWMRLPAGPDEGETWQD